MRKILALALASAMVLSLASVAMADTTVGDATAGAAAGDAWYAYDSGVKYGSDGSASGKYAPVGNMEYGKSYYLPLVTTYKQEDVDTLGTNEKWGDAELTGGATKAVVNADVVKGIKPKLDWEMNGSLIESVEIVKAKLKTEKDNGKPIYQYWLKATVVPGSSTSVKDVIGTVTLKKTGKYKTDVDIPVNVTVGIPDAGTNSEIQDVPRVFKFDEDDGDKLPEEEDFELTFEDFEDTYFTVNTVGQSNVVLQADADFNEDIAAKYPDANLDFFNGNGGSFQRTGVLTLFADEGSYLYVVNADGTLKASNAEYDQYEEAFQIKTRTLGTYVISDIDLEIPEEVIVPDITVEPATPSEPTTTPDVVEPTAPVNPIGGAIA